MKALEGILSNQTGDNVAGDVQKVMDKFAEMVRQFTSLPAFIDTMVL